MFKNELIHSIPFSLCQVNNLALENRLIRPAGIYLIRSAAVEPVIGSAKAYSFRVNYTNMRGSEGLAQRAAILSIYCLIGKARNSYIPLLIYHPGFFQKLLDLLRFGIQRYLALVHNGAKMIV